MHKFKFNVRTVSGGRLALRTTVALAAAAALMRIGTLPDALAQVPAFPSGPVSINVVDVAGDLALTQDALELYAKRNPTRVSKFTFTKAPHRNCRAN